MIRLVSRLVLRGALWALDRFYEIGRIGPELPDGPLLVVANHPNSLMDALVVLRIAGRRVRPLAKSTLFDDPLIGHVLRGLDALPIYRRQDEPSETWRNEKTFNAVVEALGRGEAALIFPEGLSHSEPSLARIKTGAARIALQAEEASDWTLELRVAPVGLTYHRKHAFRGHVAASVGEPIRVADWRVERERDAWAAVESLTEGIGRALARVTLNVPTHEDRQLIEAAEVVYATEKGLASPRARDGLAPRLPRLRRFAEAVAWLRTTRPEDYERLADRVRSYRRRLELLGVAGGELPERFPARAVLKYGLVQGAVLLIGLPLALAGTVAWYLPYTSPRVSLGVYRPEYEAVATIKLATALVAFPLTYVAWLILGWWVGSVSAAIVLAVVLPVAGLAALAWRDRWDRVREDARLFLRARGRHRLRQGLVARRRALVEEFDRLAETWEAGRSVGG